MQSQIVLKKIINNSETENGYQEFWKKLKSISQPYWYPIESDGRVFSEVIKSWGMLALLLLLIIGLVAVSAFNSFILRELVNVIEEKDLSGFVTNLAIMALSFLGLTLLTGFSKFVRKRIALDWYQWLNDYIFQKYFNRRAYYKINFDPTIDNPDQRLALVILRSFSKSFGLAGLRVGYGIANETIIEYLYSFAKPFCVNSIALTAARVALEDMPYVNASVQKICQEKDMMAQNIEQLGCFVYPSSTNFLLVKTKPLGITSKQVVQKLQDQKIFVQDCSPQLGLDEYYFRLSMGTSQENSTFLTSFTHILH